ncbi:hypothetical protein EV361DRAFT_955061 [Lentinula raphanica]|nr:hypothetical protein EV361DRAFT_955061 [Lentinula raphanica]
MDKGPASDMPNRDSLRCTSLSTASATIYTDPDPRLTAIPFNVFHHDYPNFPWRTDVVSCGVVEDARGVNFDSVFVFIVGVPREFLSDVNAHVEPVLHPVDGMRRRLGFGVGIVIVVVGLTLLRPPSRFKHYRSHRHGPHSLEFTPPLETRVPSQSIHRHSRLLIAELQTFEAASDVQRTTFNSDDNERVVGERSSKVLFSQGLIRIHRQIYTLPPPIPPPPRLPSGSLDFFYLQLITRAKLQSLRVIGETQSVKEQDEEFVSGSLQGFKRLPQWVNIRFTLASDSHKPSSAGVKQ